MGQALGLRRPRRPPALDHAYLIRQDPVVQATLLAVTADQKTLDKAAKKLLAIFEEHAKDFSQAEQETKWRAFSRVVAKIGTRL